MQLGALGLRFGVREFRLLGLEFRAYKGSWLESCRGKLPETS